MKRLKTVEGTKKEIKRLQDFVRLVENYDASTIEKKVIKEYAYLGSIEKVASKMNKEHGLTIDSTYVSQFIKSKPQDELHKLIKSHYLLKTRPSRRPY